jgi:hypothetical protein
MATGLFFMKFTLSNPPFAKGGVGGIMDAHQKSKVT